MTVDWEYALAQQLQIAQYDGTNGSEIIAGVSDAVLVGDNGTTLEFTDMFSTPYAVPVGDWVGRAAPGTFGGVYADATLEQSLFPLRDVVPLYTPDAPELVQSVGTASVPASLLGNTGVDYDVTMSPALPGAAYVPVATLVGSPTVISGHGILSVTVIDADTVRVRVQSAAASLAGGSIRVTASALT